MAVAMGPPPGKRILTTLGVISIVMGVLYGMMGFPFLAMSIGLAWRAGRHSEPAPAPPPIVLKKVKLIDGGEFVGDDGLPLRDRQVFLEYLQRRFHEQSRNAPESSVWRSVDSFLSEWGKLVLSVEDGPVTSEGLQRRVRVVVPRYLGSVLFTVEGPRGSFEVGRYGTVLFPAIHPAMIAQLAVVAPRSNWTRFRGSAAAINEVVSSVRRDSGLALTPEQVGVLIQPLAEWSNQDDWGITASRAWDGEGGKPGVRGSYRNAKRVGKATLDVEQNGVRTWIAPDGRVTQWIGPEVDPDTALPRPVPPTVKVLVPWTPVVGAIGASAVSMLLVPVLVTAGIALLVSARAGARMHRWWAWFKLVAIVVYIAAALWITATIDPELRIDAGWDRMDLAGVGYIVLPGIIAMVYPLCVLVTLRKPSVTAVLEVSGRGGGAGR